MQDLARPDAPGGAPQAPPLLAPVRRFAPPLRLARAPLNDLPAANPDVLGRHDADADLLAVDADEGHGDGIDCGLYRQPRSVLDEVHGNFYSAGSRDLN